MNIFIYDKVISENVKMYPDKHVVKMILETAQLLSTAYRISNGKKIKAIVNGKFKNWYLIDSDEYRLENTTVVITKTTVYAATHINHPCALWARASKSNFQYLLNLYHALISEWNYRYQHNKVHKSNECIFIIESDIINIKEKYLTDFAQAMPEQYRDKDVTKAYRDYFNGEKQHLAYWKNRPKPDWYMPKYKFYIK